MTNEQTARFKIDLSKKNRGWIALFHRQKRLFGKTWIQIDYFKYHEDCKTLYEKIKDLPEYLP